MHEQVHKIDLQTHPLPIVLHRKSSVVADEVGKGRTSPSILHPFEFSQFTLATVTLESMKYIYECLQTPPTAINSNRTTSLLCPVNSPSVFG